MWVWYIYLQYTDKVKIYIDQNQIEICVADEIEMELVNK